MEYDLAILGSGFAAYEIAHTSLSRGLSVAVIERGTKEPSGVNEELSRVRYRREPILSGSESLTSELWSTFGRSWNVVPRLSTLLGSVAIDDAIRFRGASHHAGALFMGEPGFGHVNADCRFPRRRQPVQRLVGSFSPRRFGESDADGGRAGAPTRRPSIVSGPVVRRSPRVLVAGAGWRAWRFVVPALVNAGVRADHITILRRSADAPTPPPLRALPHHHRAGGIAR
jgi:hypothetical protein